MIDADSLQRIALAFDMATRAHEGQRRGHGRGEPFINHVADVARRVSRSAAVDETTIIAALLHDVVEKTDHTLDDIEATFGAEVAKVVGEMTDDPSLSRKARRRRQIEEAPSLSSRAKRVKLADKASKMASIAETPPRWWNRSKVRGEVDWARQVVSGLTGTDPDLEADFDVEWRRADSAVGS
ncbi:HD domain-containing protein [Rubellimicrobium arenae]|uniref:HD domain-containing protein n=1 Tax=Rubellimicrobium arenae TaxID=2817372 RepID=UPI001B302F6D|nr:HD domain-containing protein [Rubellimicrobium arenae]